MKKKLDLKYRRLVVGVDEKVPLLDGSYVTAINFDNAATTPPFKRVLKEVNTFAPWYSSIHRGTGYKSILSSDLFEDGRKRIKDFVGADEDDIVIYTKNTTEAINIVANALRYQAEGKIVLCTDMEHLANDLPWRSSFAMDYVKIDHEGKLDLNDLEYKLKGYQGNVRLVTVTGASNVTGYINSIQQISQLTHRYGAELFVDGAQLVPHRTIHMQAEGIDYLAFSAHKMYAPFGSGALIGRREIFKHCQPNTKGGGAVKLVTHDFVDWDKPPYKEEAGTPNVIGVAAMLAAICCLQKLDMQEVHHDEQELITYIIRGLRKIKGICLYGCPRVCGDKVSIIAFTLPDIEHRLIAKILSYEGGIAVRSGLFCAHPYVQKLLGLTKEAIEWYRQNPQVNIPGLVRVSLGIYNTYPEADRLLYHVRLIAENSEYFKEKYQNIDQQPDTSKLLLHPLSRQLP